MTPEQMQHLSWAIIELLTKRDVSPEDAAAVISRLLMAFIFVGASDRDDARQRVAQFVADAESVIGSDGFDEVRETAQQALEQVCKR